MMPRIKSNRWYALACLFLAVSSFGLAITHGFRWAESRHPADHALEAFMWLIFGIAWSIRFWQRNNPSHVALDIEADNKN